LIKNYNINRSKNANLSKFSHHKTFLLKVHSCYCVLKDNITLLLSILFFLFHASVICYSQQRNLNFYIQSAINNNPVINENRALTTTYLTQKELVKASTTSPTLFTTANYLFAPTFGEYGYDSSVTNGGLYSVMLNLEYPLFRGSAYSIKLKNLQTDQSTYKNTIALTEHDIEREVTDQYIKAYIDRKQIDYTDEILGYLSSEREVLESLAKNDLAMMTDIKLLDIEYQNQVIGRVEQVNQYRSELMQLNLAAGIQDTSLIELAKPDIPFNKANVPNSNFLVQYQIDSIKLETEQKLFELNYQPQLDFFMNSGLNAVTYKDIYKKVGFSLGFNFTFGLYDGNQKSLSRQITVIRQDIIAKNKSNFIKQNELRKANILKELDDLEKTYALQQTQSGNYISLINLLQQEISAGLVSVIDYINTLKNYISVKSDLLSIESKRMTLINEYNYRNW
jgi:outer membrane protein TolC